MRRVMHGKQCPRCGRMFFTLKKDRELCVCCMKAEARAAKAARLCADVAKAKCEVPKPRMRDVVEDIGRLQNHVQDVEYGVQNGKERKQCQECEAWFWSTKKERTLCDRCRARAARVSKSRTWITKLCQDCGVEFKASGDEIYCRRCKRIHNGALVETPVKRERVCHKCGKPSKGQYWCDKCRPRGDDWEDL